MGQGQVQEVVQEAVEQGGGWVKEAGSEGEPRDGGHETVGRLHRIEVMEVGRRQADREGLDRHRRERIGKPSHQIVDPMLAMRSQEDLQVE